MEKEFWLQKWQNGETRFHQSKYHPALEKFADRFSEGTIFVPLCGKTLDMLYLSSIGHKVIGVELSPIACQDFFIENGLTFTHKTIADFEVYESDEITLYCGDFFKLPDDVCKRITGIYDRAALVALPETMRAQYAAEIGKRSPQAQILLVSFEYPEGTIQGPPFSVPEAEIRHIYQNRKVTKIHSVNELVRTTPVNESVYWLS